MSTSHYRHIWSLKMNRRTFKLFIPKSKNKKLDAMAKVQDTITLKDLESIGVSRIRQVLDGCERRLGIKIIQIDKEIWQICR